MAKEITIRQRVMEAGFGATLERHGFVKAGVTHYKKEEDFGFWRVTLGKGFPNMTAPDSFRDGTGFQIKGIDPIVKEFQKRTGNKLVKNFFLKIGLPGTQVMVDFESSILWTLQDEDPGPKYPPPPPPPPKGFWQRIFGAPTPKSYEPFWDYHPDIERHFGKYAAWRLRESRSFEDFAEELSGYWERLYADKVRDGAFLMEHKEQWLRNAGPDNIILRKKATGYLWLAGYQEALRESFRRCEERFSQPDEHIAKLVIERSWRGPEVDWNSPEEKAKMTQRVSDYRIQFERLKILMGILEEL